MFTELFAVLKDDFDVTLFKSGGARSAREKVPPLLSATTAIARALPLGGHAGGAKYKADCLAFGLSLLPELLHQRFDVIHCIDPPLAKFLSYLQRVFRFPGRLLFTEGCRMPPRFYPRVDHVHHVGMVAFQQALAMGIPESHLTMIPTGLHARQFAESAGRRELRKKHAISENTFVILAVSNVERVFKRVDYIIEEVSQLEGDILLWIDGHPEDPTLPVLASQKLGSKCRITYVPSSDVPELYHLADVMAHASVDEAFGRAVLEALCAGLMVLVHDCPHFQWLVQDPDCLVDMSASGNLTARLREILARRENVGSRAQARAATASQRFDWRSLAPAYFDMYRKVAALKFSYGPEQKKSIMSELPPTNPPPRTAQERLGAFIARHRRGLPARKIANLCARYLSWYGNFSYDLRTNGEAFIVETLAAFQPRVLFDAGANVGDWSVAAKRCCPGAEIHAFEIAQPTFVSLVANTRHLPQMHCENVGLADAGGPIRIRHYGAFPALTTSTNYPHPLPFSEVDAQVITGDSYVARKGIHHIDLLKIDVEGMEEQVLRGFQKTFQQGAIDLVQFEYGRVSIVNHFLLRDAYLFFRQNGFVVGKIYPNYVDFRDYDMSDEDFMGPNYLACREDMMEYIKAFSDPNGAVSSARPHW